VATEPLRRAADAARVVHEIQRSSGAPVHVLSHDEEGVLTLLGVTAGRRVERDVVVVDIGGGSTEFVVVGRGTRPLVTGVPAGAATLTQRLVEHDPPTADELGSMLARARTLVERAPIARPEDLVAVGGTASNLVKVVTGDPSDPSLSADEVRTALDAFSELPAQTLTERFLVNPVRARILPAGAAILLALLERYGVERLRVSHTGIREGTLLAVTRGGPGWRDRLPRLAAGWRDG
jgi:exopolyphosphatase/guanosine-5'-triphosphate,3'-diphosphate pyrophosphatase